jgi:hypothetical protein
MSCFKVTESLSLYWVSNIKQEILLEDQERDVSDVVKTPFPAIS